VSEIAPAVTAEKQKAVSQRSDVAVTHVAARRGKRDEVIAAARTAFGVDLPLTARVVQAGDATIVWAGPEQWLILEPMAKGADASGRHATTFGGLASVLDVSDSRAIFRVSTAAPTDALVRSMSIDFENTSFKPGDVAITQVSHLGVMVWRLPDGSGYEFACARTYARDFLSWLSKT
jgi:heterotetrameric sarcosine oxidase gamma subunit